jgi:hypothetical protein
MSLSRRVLLTDDMITQHETETMRSSRECQTERKQSINHNPLVEYIPTSSMHSIKHSRSTNERRTHRTIIFPSPRLLTFCLLILSLLIKETRAQLGETTCSCAPSAYLLRLNVELPCSDGTLMAGDGIVDIDCVTNPPFTGSASDLNITSVTFLELDQNLQLLTSSTVTDNLKNGDTVEFASFTATNLDEVTLTKLPSTIEVGIMAQDKDMNSILTNWVISFSNACDAYPFISVGDTIGFSEFVRAVMKSQTWYILLAPIMTHIIIFFLL